MISKNISELPEIFLIPIPGPGILTYLFMMSMHAPTLEQIFLHYSTTIFLGFVGNSMGWFFFSIIMEN